MLAEQPRPTFAPALQVAQPPPERQVIVVHHGGGPSFFSAYWMIRLGIVALVLLGSGGRWAFHHFGAGSTGDWSGRQPLVCAGDDQIDAYDVKASFGGGTAILASGNCQVTCRNCSLTAATVVQAEGDAHVTLTGGSISGTQASVVVSGDATVDVAGCGVTGAARKSGDGTINGMTVAAPVAAAAAPPLPTAPAAAAVHAPAPAAHPAAPLAPSLHAAPPPSPRHH